MIKSKVIGVFFFFSLVACPYCFSSVFICPNILAYIFLMRILQFGKLRSVQEILH